MNLFADVIGPGVIRRRRRGRPRRRRAATVATSRPGARRSSTTCRRWGPAAATDNVAGYLWSKLGFGAMLAATALADAPMAELIDRHRPAMHALAAEVYAVAAAEGITPGAVRRVRPAAVRGRRRRRPSSAATDALVAWLRTQTKDPQRHLARHRGAAPAHRGARRTTRPVLAAAARHGIAVPGARSGWSPRSASWRRGRGDGRGPHRGGSPAGAAVTAVPPPTAVDGIDVAGLRRWLDEQRGPLRGGPGRLRRAGDAERRSRVALASGLAHLEEWLVARLGPPASAGCTTIPASTATSWSSGTQARVTVR